MRAKQILYALSALLVLLWLDSIRDYINKYPLILIILVTIIWLLYLRVEQKDNFEKMAARIEGTLKLGRISQSRSIALSKYPTLEIGNSGAFIQNQAIGNLALNAFNNMNLTIRKSFWGLKLSAMIRSKSGLVANIVDNQWRVNPNEYFDRNYNKNALEVIDNNGHVILQVVLMDDRIRVQCISYNENGGCVTIAATDEGNAIIGINKPYEIRPIFKYPSRSNLHKVSNNYMFKKSKNDSTPNNPKYGIIFKK